MRILLYFFVFFSISGLIAIIYFSFFSSPGASDLLVVKNLPGASMQGVRYSGSSESGTGWELEADEAKHLKESGLIEFSSVKLEYFSKENKTSTLSSRSAIFNETQGELEFQGHVQVQSKDKYKLKTETLMYSTKTGVVTSKERVEFTTNGINVVGNGLSIDIDSERLFIYGGVVATLDDLSI
ncbi:MAG: LPS export ABC transporter periplasmic protein LptC [Deltaproteobacteria bacterium]|nr:LPS export ABC transporter periplasmic protein LptC [Deltaproteobacteria bacterium]